MTTDFRPSIRRALQNDSPLIWLFSVLHRPSIPCWPSEVISALALLIAIRQLQTEASFWLLFRRETDRHIVVKVGGKGAIGGDSFTALLDVCRTTKEAA